MKILILTIVLNGVFSISYAQEAKPIGTPINDDVKIERRIKQATGPMRPENLTAQNKNTATFYPETLNKPAFISMGGQETHPYNNNRIKEYKFHSLYTYTHADFYPAR